MKKRLLAAILSVVLVFGLVACGGNTQPTEGSTGTQKTTTGSSEVVKEEPVSLRLVLYGEASERNTEFFRNEFHERVMEDLNIDMTIEFRAWGATDQIAVMAASGEAFGFMAAITNVTFPEWASAGYFATIDEKLVEEYGPKYLEARMGRGFECCKYKGDIVLFPFSAVPRAGQQDNFTIRNDILNQVGWDYTQIKTYDDLMNAIAAVKEKYPDMYVIGTSQSLFKGLNSVYAKDGAILKTGTYMDLVRIDDSNDTDEVISWFESDYFKELCKLTKEWQELGYLTPEYVENDTSSGGPAAQWDAGNALMTFGAISNIFNHTSPGFPVEEADFQYLVLEGNYPPVLEKDYDWAIGISAADQDNVKHWIRFFNWMYESKENYDFCTKGIEGVDYIIKEDGTEEKITNVQLFQNWMFDTLMYQEMRPEFDADEYQKWVDWDSNAVVSKKVGFAFDPTNVETEVALLTAIVQEKIKPVLYGLVSYDDAMPGILAEMKAAGLDKYVAEYQRQFTEFMATK